RLRVAGRRAVHPEGLQPAPPHRKEPGGCRGSGLLLRRGKPRPTLTLRKKTSKYKPWYKRKGHQPPFHTNKENHYGEKSGVSAGTGHGVCRQGARRPESRSGVAGAGA